MGIELIVDKYKNDLPGYSLTGYGEVGFPQYKCRLLCLMLKDKRLPVVDEFVLRLYKEDVSLEDMGPLLGLEQDFVDSSWYNLMHLGLIHTETKWITEKGYSYLREHRIDSHEKVSIDVVIDGLTGKIKRNRAFINRKSVRETNLDVLRPLIPPPSENNIKVSQLKRIMSEYKANDAENYTGSLLDIIEVENTPTQYKRLNILIFSNSIGDFRFLVCDDAQRYEEYESSLLSLEESGIGVLNHEIGDYFKNNDLYYIDRIKKDVNKELSPLEIRNNIYDMVRNCEEKLFISIPLVKIKTFDDAFIDLLNNKLKEKVKVFLLTSGREFSDTYQKNQFEKLLKLKKKYLNLIIGNTPKFQINALISDNKGIVSYLRSHDLKLPTSTIGVTETGFLLDSKQTNNCVSEIFSVLTDANHDYVLISKQELSEKLFKIVQLVTDFDEYLLNKNNIGWIGGQSVPDVQRLLESPVATTENNFKVFISSIHTSLGESLEKNGKAHGDKYYFWNYFKETFPELQKVLHKIRIYRHSTEHISLEDKPKESYFRFLNEDLNGSIPFLKEHGYHILQTKIIIDLEKSLENVLLHNN
jgi:hypothetical protein